MVRRFLLTVLLSVLAIALPASAQETSVSEPAAGSAAQGCPLSDLACLPDPDSACDALEGCPPGDSDLVLASALYGGGGGGSCRPWDMNLPDDSQPIEETLILDPDGCTRDCVREIISCLDPWSLFSGVVRLSSPVISLTLHS